MNADIPKQFLFLAGEPVLMHTIRIFHLYDPSMLLFVVLSEKYIPLWKELCRERSFAIPHQIIKGGTNRFGSVRNALEEISGEGFVAIHDGVRPLVSLETLGRTFTGAAKYGNSVPVIPMKESIRETGPGGNKEVLRDNLRIVQTPQVFRISIIKKAYTSAPHQSFTDDATVMETLGETIHLVEGNPENIKLTSPSDLICAEAILRHSTLQDE
jgi:2-C-methyl-D-erythritol 4-phosphate cytidylyltransferase